MEKKAKNQSVENIGEHLIFIDSDVPRLRDALA
jgi:hypothetical protein